MDQTEVYDWWGRGSKEEGRVLMIHALDGRRLHVLKFRGRSMSVSGTTLDSAMLKAYLEWDLLTERAVGDCIKTQPKIFYSNGIRKLVNR